MNCVLAAPWAILFQFNFPFNFALIFASPMIDAFAFFALQFKYIVLGHKIKFLVYSYYFLFNPDPSLLSG